MSILLTIDVLQKYNKCFAITIGSLPINNAQQNYRKTIGKKEEEIMTYTLSVIKILVHKVRMTL